MFLLVHGHFEENCIPDGFLFKRAFQIRMKKGMQVLSNDIPCHMHSVVHSSLCISSCAAPCIPTPCCATTTAEHIGPCTTKVLKCEHGELIRSYHAGNMQLTVSHEELI
jgi:hypothetical protein